MQYIKEQSGPVPAGVPFVKATLPLPPSVNASYKVVSHTVHNKTMGRTQVVHRLGGTEALEDFKCNATLCLLAIDTSSINNTVVKSILDLSRQSQPVHTPLRLQITFYFSTLWKRDVDGGVKAVQDVLFHRLMLNDNLVTELLVKKKVDAKNPRVEVELSIAEE